MSHCYSVGLLPTFWEFSTEGTQWGITDQQVKVSTSQMEMMWISEVQFILPWCCAGTKYASSVLKNSKKPATTYALDAGQSMELTRKSMPSGVLLGRTVLQQGGLCSCSHCLVPLKHLLLDSSSGRQLALLCYVYSQCHYLGLSTVYSVQFWF